MRRSFCRSLPLVSWLCLSGCVSNNLPTAVTTPASPTSNSTAAKRVVALTSLSADIVQRLSPDKLVGVGGSSLVNQNPSLGKIPRVSEGRTPPNLEKIVALQPDLVIGAEGMHDGVLSKLQQMGIKSMATKVDRWESLAQLTKTIATAIQADPTPLIKSYDGYFATKPAKTASTLVLASDQPLTAPNSKSWAGDLLNKLGVKNVVADLQGKSQFAGYLTLSPEKVVEIDPEVVLLVKAPGTDIDKVSANPVLKGLKATKNKRVHVVDYYGLVNPGSIESIDRAVKQMQTIYQ